MKIGPHEIDGSRCFIIAEAGTNHLGSFDSAIAHAVCAKEKGADAVKFQMFHPEEPLFCPLPDDEKRWDRWKKSCLPLDAWKAVKSFCDGHGIVFLASAFQHTTVKWLKEMSVAAYKVASRAALTYPYDEVPGPFIVSLGILSGQAVTSDGKNNRPRPGDNATYMQCVMEYPTPLARARWDTRFCNAPGLSDHSGTIWPGLDAMARGCPMLEVHFAIDKSDAGPDAPVCLTPYELHTLCYANQAFAEMRGHET